MAQMLAGDIRKGSTFEYKSGVYTVTDFQHVKPGKEMCIRDRKGAAPIQREHHPRVRLLRELRADGADDQVHRRPQQQKEQGDRRKADRDGEQPRGEQVLRVPPHLAVQPVVGGRPPDRVPRDEEKGRIQDLRQCT